MSRPAAILIRIHRLLGHPARSRALPLESALLRVDVLQAPCLLALDHDDLHPHTSCHFLAHLLQSTPAVVLLDMLSRYIALFTLPLLLGARVERRF